MEYGGRVKYCTCPSSTTVLMSFLYALKSLINSVYSVTLYKDLKLLVLLLKKKKKMKLYRYVKFTVTSTDNVWTSKVIHAIVAPGLCMPVILGLLFLIHNDIVTDHAQCSCIDKKMGYNLLNPMPVHPPPPPCKRLKEQINDTKAAKKKVLSELKEVCWKHIAEKKLTFGSRM